MSDGGLKVGDLFFSVGVKMSEFHKGMQQVADAVAKKAKQIEEIGNKLGQVGAVMSGGIVASMMTAAKANSAMAADLERAKKLFFTLGVEIGELFAPALKQAADRIGTIVAWFQGLNPELKSSIAGFVGTTAGVLTAAGAIGKLSGVVSVVAKGFSMLLGTISLPFLAIVAGVGLAVLAFGALYKAWNDTGSGIQEGVKEIWEGFKHYIGMIGEAWSKLMHKLVDFMAESVAALGDVIAPLAEMLGLDSLKSFAVSMQGMTGDKLLSGLERGAEAIIDAGVSAGKAIGSGVKFGWSGVQDMLADAQRLISNPGGAARIRNPLDTKTEDPILKGIQQTNAANERFEAGWKQYEQFGEFIAETQKGAAEEVAYTSKIITDAWAEAGQEAERAALAARGVFVTIGQKFLSAMGRAGSVIEDAFKAFENGGVLGAAASVVGDLLMSSTQFQTLMQMVDNFFQIISDTVGAVLVPILPVVATAFDIVATLFKALEPVLVSVTEPLMALAPLLQVVGTIVQGLAPVITVLGNALVTYLAWPLKLLEPALKLLFPVITKVAAGMLWFVVQVSNLWNGIIKTIQGVFNALSRVPLIGKAMKGISDSLGGLLVDTSEMSKAQRALKDATWDTAMAAAMESAERWKNVDAMQKATEALTNVPAGYKVALARFNAQDPTGSGVARAVDSAQRSGPPPGARNPSGGIVININGSDRSPAEIAEEVVRVQQREQFVQTGTRLSSASRSRASRMHER